MRGPGCHNFTFSLPLFNICLPGTKTKLLNVKFNPRPSDSWIVSQKNNSFHDGMQSKACIGLRAPESLSTTVATNLSSRLESRPSFYIPRFVCRSMEINIPEKAIAYALIGNTVMSVIFPTACTPAGARTDRYLPNMG